MDWLQKSAWLLPNWAWIAIAAVIVVLAIVIIAVAVSGSKRKKKAQSAQKQSSEEAAAEAEYIPAQEPEKHEVISGFYEPDNGYTQPVTYTAPEEQIEGYPEEEEESGAYEVSVKVEEQALETKKAQSKTSANKPAAKKATAKKEEPAKATAAKTTTKPAAKKEEAKPVAKKTAAKKEEPAKSTAAKTTAKPAAKKEEAKPVAKKPAAKKEATDEEKKVYHISKRKEDGMWQIKASGGAKAIKLFRTQAEAIDAAVTLAQNQGGRVVVHKANGAFKSISLANYVSKS